MCFNGFIALTQQNNIVTALENVFSVTLTQFFTVWESLRELLRNSGTATLWWVSATLTLTPPSVKKAPADQIGPKQTENKEWPLAPLLFSTLPQTPKLQGNSSSSNCPSWH